MSPTTLPVVGSHIDGPPAQFAGQEGFRAAGKAALTSNLQPTPADEVHDLVCVGFGPASLAVAVALHDALESGKLTTPPKVLFLEKQNQFAWHAGMLLPGAKMQISFIKDLASLRNPRSEFTFLNFLHEHDRLVDFINLSTFLPARTEYEEYMRWCAEHFGNVVRYGQEVVSVSPQTASQGDDPVSRFAISSRSSASGEVSTIRAKNVLVAVGGQASIPRSLPAKHPRVIHSSEYAYMVPKILSNRDAAYRVAVIGAGQSAAEIYTNVQALYPNSRTDLVMRSEFLKPADDSPFVNCIFNPEYIDSLYPRSAAQRQSVLKDARATNYAVVRLELIEKIFELMYEQKRELGPDERNWRHRIHNLTEVMGLDSDDLEQEKLRMRIRSLRDFAIPDGSDSGVSVDGASEAGDETLEVDLIIAATGYQRTQHLQMMEDMQPLLPMEPVEGSDKVSIDGNGNGELKLKPVRRNMHVGRDYGVQFAPGKVAEGSGIWLQGCNEKTHGLSDTLLSVLATRSAEIVDSIFGAQKN